MKIARKLTPHEATLVCQMFPSLLRSEFKTEFDKHLATLTALARQSIGNLLHLARNQSLFKFEMERQWAILNALLQVLIEAIGKLEDFETDELMEIARREKKNPSRALPGGRTAAESLLRTYAGFLDKWPVLLTPRRQHALDRFKSVREKLRLGEFYHRNIRRRKEAKESVEMTLGKALHDRIHLERQHAGCTDINRACHQLKTPIKKHKAEWRKVAKRILRDWYGQKISKHPHFAKDSRSSSELERDILRAFFNDEPLWCVSGARNSE